MTSVGVMASSVVSGVDVLLENFTSVADWSGSMTSVVGGRTGNAGQLTGTTTADFTIPAINENATTTVGVAYKVSSLAAVRPFLILKSDTTTNHDTVRVNINGSLSVLLGGTAGTALGTTAATGLVVANTYAYIETQVFLDDTLGTVKLRVNGTEVLNLSGVDTKLGGTKTVFDTIRLNSSSGSTALFDDLYITMGAGAPFKGDTTIP